MKNIKEPGDQAKEDAGMRKAKTNLPDAPSPSPHSPATSTNSEVVTNTAPPPDATASLDEGPPPRPEDPPSDAAAFESDQSASDESPAIGDQSEDLPAATGNGAAESNASADAVASDAPAEINVEPDAGNAEPNVDSDKINVERAQLTPSEMGRRSAEAKKQRKLAAKAAGPASHVIRLEGGNEGNDGCGSDGGGGQGGGGGNGGDEPTRPPESGSHAVKALRWFFSKLTLLDDDREMLWVKRGLTAKTCEQLGYKSNRAGNKDILLDMVEETPTGTEGKFPVAALIEAGLFSPGEAGQPAKPNGQFFGYGLIARGRDAEGKKTEQWGWSYPVLIGYFDAHGELIHIRPHKGGIRGMPPRLYIARIQKSARSTMVRPREKADYAICCEGEFKAAALFQALDGGSGEIAIASLPGITMSSPLFGDIEDFLDDTHARRVLVSFDSENKSDERLPGYVKDPRKRHDAQIWSRKLAKEVSREGYEGRVCLLPDEWRNESGKADHDSSLRMLITRHLAGKPVVPSAENPQPLSNLQWETVKVAVRREFLRVLNTATPVHELYQFFDSEQERIIQNALLRLEYVRGLPVGGEKEEALVRRLQRVGRKLRLEPTRIAASETAARPLIGFLFFLAKQYQGVMGGYYTCRKLTPLNEQRWLEALAWAHAHDDVEIKRAAETVIEGIPEAAADFWMDARYVLIRPNGKRDRLVVIISKHVGADGQRVRSGLIALPSAPFAQPSKLREWLLDAGGFAWLAGERALNKLQVDINRDTLRMEVTEVTIRGYHEESRLWILEDVSYTPDGAELLPDANGIVWFKGAGYKISDKDHEGEQFTQSGRKKPYGPRMQPGRKIEQEGQTEFEAVQGLAQELICRLYETLGSCDGLAVLSMMLAYGAGPELYQDCGNQFPGGWYHGETGQGKSSLARWMMRIWGFNMESGITLKGSSAPGLSIALQQYGDSPVWVEEVQIDSEAALMEKLKNVFDRASGVKKNFNTDRRKILAGALVTGIARSTDAQVLARYFHVPVASANRLASHFHWLQEHSPNFFFLGRYLLRHREEYVALTRRFMATWMKSDAMREVEPRTRITHGVAWASLMAFLALLQLELPEVLKRNENTPKQKET